MSEGTAGERAGAAYSEPAAAAPKRAYGRGDTARKHRNVRLDPANDAAVAELAAEHFGGNYSAALDHVLARARELADEVTELRRDIDVELGGSGDVEPASWSAPAGWRAPDPLGTEPPAPPS